MYDERAAELAGDSPAPPKRFARAEVCPAGVEMLRPEGVLNRGRGRDDPARNLRPLDSPGSQSAACCAAVMGQARGGLPEDGYPE